ncbi:MAG TPA: acyltransferase family protein [Naasia sp.]|jgi:peptidoglycan/LPS O-acetylase OafA/YrhL
MTALSRARPSASPSSDAADHRPRQEVRPEIQALRAVAVLLVVVYHFWPQYLPGGYVGVDVFFVISGYLITKHLVNEARRRGTIDLPGFWARRVRRLLPASLLVIVVSAVATLLWVPRTFWSQFAREMIGSVTYILNWLLARDSVDYLASENNASPVQHYWSLSLEEQFYLVWPLLIVAVALTLRRKPFAEASFTRRTVTVLAAVTAVSLAISIVMTPIDPGSAYFVTPTRVWEFGVGGLLGILATATRVSGPARAMLGWLGVLGIVATGFLFSSSTQFPGFTALLPVLATAAVIWSGGSSLTWSPGALARFRPLQFLGDVSYSFYLWHWPLIILFPYAVGRPISPVDSWVLFALSILLAWVTKRYVEDVARGAKRVAGRKPRFTFVLLAAAMIGASLAPGAAFAISRAEVQESRTLTAQLLNEDTQCLGAAAMLGACDNPQLDGVLIPTLAALKLDNGNAYDCYPGVPPSGELLDCSWGPDGPDALRVAIQGDSHAAMLTQALIPLLDELNWHLESYSAQGCRWRTVDGSPGSVEPPLNQSDEDCRPFRAAIDERFRMGAYDLILVTGYRGERTGSQVEVLAEDQAAVWAPVAAAGTTIVAITDNAAPLEMADCVINTVTRGSDGRDCVIPLERLADTPDSMPVTVPLVPGSVLIDLQDLYCTDAGCPMVIGNVIVHRDEHHLSATYARTVAPILVQRICDAVEEC